MNPHAGQAVYSPVTLAVYDAFVLGFSNRFVWRCPTSRLLAHYRANMSANHLDIGVGTGFFLDRAGFPEGARICLVDLNAHCLETAARRIARFEPDTHRANVLEAFSPLGAPFDSIGMNYLLHCLPGDLQSKARVFDHAAAHLRPGGVLFGATLLQGGVERSASARGLMECYNRRGIFSNRGDDLEGLRTALEARFAEVRIEVAGCAGLFRGKKE